MPPPLLLLPLRPRWRRSRRGTIILLGVLLLHDASGRIVFKFLAPETFCARLFPLLCCGWRARATQAAAAAVAGADNAGSRSSNQAAPDATHLRNPDVTLTSPGHCNTPTGQSFGERSIAQFLLLISLWTTVVIKIQTGRHRKTVFCELLPRTEACTMVVCNTFVVVLKVIE
jgi:hypothetical protein